ncbi:hypothetical protein BDK88_2002 [Natrinema hispanicum]|uniref:Right handed beta helix region n=1 Tax=Natrinema hispanicum TaxID=392421 RepID=A0A482YDS4_9EURY|nr:right-handed parallel beta-helix repeat-containing protein [Natrinema hispanicum]RZV10811.1 hypothetical protein BDK88_2002 [Natrinema hispanicum]
MARESENGAVGPSGTGSTCNGGRNSPSLSRRSYLKLAGSATLAAAAAKTAAATEDDYEVITVAAGDTHSVRLGDGDRLENVLIDITAQGSGYDIQAVGDDWVIQNVGIRGAWDHSPRASPFRVAVESADASARIENLYLGDGVAGSFSPNAEPTGLYAYWYHAGTLEIRNVNVQGFSDNGMYLSAPGNSEFHPNPGHGGEIHIYDSYAKDNQISGFRLGTDGSFCKNCVAVGGSHRGFWGYYGHTELIGCDLIDNNSGDIKLGTRPWDKSKQADVTVTDTRFGTVSTQSDTNDVYGSSAGSPEDRIPEGVPMTPVEAAAGTSSSGSSGSSSGDQTTEKNIEDVWLEDEANEIVFSAGSDSRAQQYRLTGHGRAETSDGADTGANDQYADSVSTDGDTFTLEGYLGSSGSDGFTVSGAVTTVAVDSGISVRVNGVEFDPSDVEGIGSWDQEHENTLLVDGVGTNGTSRYEFTVSGSAERSTYKGASIDEEDTIDSGQVTGALAGWRDAFRFSGELEELTVDGAARIYVNDQRVDPAVYGDDRPHVLTLVGNGTSANYEISVDGTIDTVAGDEAEQYATVTSENTVEGSIERSAQRFEFSGTLTDITFRTGSAHVYLDETRIDPDEYGDQELLPNALVIDGTETDGETTYSFTVDGEAITASYRDASIDAGDVIDGRSVSGSVDDSVDAYWFDGDIADFQLRGNATVDVEYDAREQ